MSEMMVAGKLTQVWPYYSCNACGFRTPASGGDVHKEVLCNCKQGMLRRFVSLTPPKFPRTGFEGREPAALENSPILDASGDPIVKAPLVVPDEPVLVDASSEPEMKDRPAPAPEAAPEE